MEEVARDLRLMPNGMARIVAQALSFVKKSKGAAKYRRGVEKGLIGLKR